MTNSPTDLEDVIKQWGWGMYLKTTNGSNLSFETAQIDVIWDKVHFKTEQPKFYNTKGSLNPQTQILFSSTFDNDTDHFQHHNFQTSRTTTASAKINLTHGFTRGLNAGVKMPIPNDVLKTTAVFGNSITIDSQEEKIVEHALNWTVNTTVKAPKGQRTVADLEIVENVYNCNFEMDVTLKGTLLVKISDPVTDRVVKVVQNKIATILNDIYKMTPPPKAFTFSYKGSVLFHYGIRQMVRVHHGEEGDGERVEEEQEEQEDEDEDEDEGW